ncbi:MAG: pyruvate kinase [Alphaproteobacteria bacterium]
MYRERNIKIVATLGPGSSTKDRIRDLFKAGVDTFRLNMSHADHATFDGLHKAIREVEQEAGRPIGILVDLQGPKIRLGEMALQDSGEPFEITAGQTFDLDMDETAGDNTRAPLPHPEIFAAIKPGSLLLIDDGRLRLEVLEVDKSKATTKVLAGGKITSRKGVNLPNEVLEIAALTEKDLADLTHALEQGVDWVALSFVQRSEDVTETKARIGGRAAIMSKIEKPAALADIQNIVRESDGVMVARGDLGVELPVEKVPAAQRRIIAAARRAGKPVVVATQMLESMINAPIPTRAEVTDVSTAVMEGADAVMLSAETAVGSYAEEAVQTMDRVGRETEADPAYRAVVNQAANPPEPTDADAIAAAARQTAETIGAKAIICYTSSGSTGMRVARERPRVRPVVFTPIAHTARKLALVWGVHCVVTEDADSFSSMVAKACEKAVAEGFAGLGDSIVITAGVPFGTPGRTNIMRIATIREHHSQPQNR